METKDTHIEGLEEIALRECMRVEGDYDGYVFTIDRLEALLADPAILAHIPAVKALQEEVERLKAGADSKHHLMRIIIEAKDGKLSVASSNGQAVPDGRYWFHGHPLTNIEENRLRKRIATLEATNAAQAERIGELEAGLRQARAWLSGWASAEPYLSIIDALLQSSTPAESEINHD